MLGKAEASEPVAKDAELPRPIARMGGSMGPRRDVPPEAERRWISRRRVALREQWERMFRRFPDLRDPSTRGGEGVPVDPDRPNHLTGGAAAALEFDDE